MFRMQQHFYLEEQLWQHKYLYIHLQLLWISSLGGGVDVNCTARFQVYEYSGKRIIYKLKFSLIISHLWTSTYSYTKLEVVPRS